MDFSQFDLTDPFVRRALAETLAEDNGLDYQDEYIRKALNDEIAAAAAPKPIDGERNFFGDTVSRLARGGVQLADAAIHAVDTAVGGSETLQGWSDSLDKAKQNVGLLRPDKSEHEEGWLKRSYGQALESAPMSAVPWAGAMAGASMGAVAGPAGAVAGGLIGGTLAMGGLFGLGTYGQRKEEVERELTATRPDLTPDEISKMAHDNAKNHAFAETGGESAGDLASWAILSKVPGGQAIFKGGKAILAELVKPNAFKAIALGVGKAMPFEVGSEVGTAIWQNEADKAIGVEQGTSTDAALAAIGPAMFLSAGMGVAVGGYSANQRRVQYNALNSEDQETRAQAVDQVAGTLAEATDQQTAKKWRDMALGFVQNGQPIPLDMNLAELSANEPEVAAPEAQDQPAETILKAESVDEAIQEAEAEIAKPGWLAPTAPDLEESAWLQHGVAAKAYNQGRNELGATPVSRAGLLGQAMEPMQVAAPADPLTEVLTTISTADQPTLLQMADGLPGLVEGSPELAPYQRQLSEAITERQRILWEESNVGRGKVSGDSGDAQGQPGQPAGIRDIEPIRGDSGRKGDGESGEGGSGTTEESPLLTAARQHVAETGDMTMGGLAMALDVDIDTAEKLLEQVKATTPLPRNVGGTQAATVGADTGGFLNDQAIRKAGATSTATTAGDAQGFIADQGIRKAAGAVTAAPVADTEGFVRDQQIRRDAMGRGPKPTRAADEPARAFLARKREWEKGEAKPLAEEMFSAANKITGGGAANPFVLSKKGQVEVMSRAAKEIDPRLNTDERFHDALTSVGAVGRLPVRSANRKLASAFSSILSYRLDPESSRLEMAAALRGDEDEMARLVDKNALVRMRRNEDNSEDYELTNLGKKLLARFGEIEAVTITKKNISVSSRAENETQTELPRTDETQAGGQGGGQGEYDYDLSAVWRGRAPQVAAPTVLKSAAGGKEYAIPGLEELRVTVKPPSGNKAKHTKLGWSVYVGDNLIWANLPGVADTAENAINAARGKLKRIHAAIAKDQAQTTPKTTSTAHQPSVEGVTAPSPGEASPPPAAQPSASKATLDGLEAVVAQKRAGVERTLAAMKKGTKAQKEAAGREHLFAKKELQGWEQVLEDVRAEQQPPTTPAQDRTPEKPAGVATSGQRQEQGADAKPRKDAGMADVAETDFGNMEQPAQVGADAYSSIERELQRAAHKGRKDGDIEAPLNWPGPDWSMEYYVSMADAVAAARRFVAAGGRPVPFQVHNGIGVSLGDADAIIAALDSPAPAEAAIVEPEAIPEQRLLDTGFLREFRDRWQYKLAGNNGWFTADRKEDAVERARKAYEKTPEPERLTAQERFDKSTAEQNADIERLYGDNSLPELRKEYARMEREIASLQKAGRREFDGNGGRRTGAAVSNEGARNIGEQKLKLGRYIEDREKAEKESTPTRLHTVSGYPSDNATKKHMLEAIAEARKELPEPSPKDGFSNAERIDWPKPTTEKSHKIYRLAGNFKLVVDPTGYARLVEDMGSSGKDGSKIPDKVHGKPIGSLAEAKLWAEYYLLGKTEPSGPPHVFRGKNKEYEYTIPNSAYALDNFEKKVKGSSGVKFAKAVNDQPSYKKGDRITASEGAPKLIAGKVGKISGKWGGSQYMVEFDGVGKFVLNAGEILPAAGKAQRFKQISEQENEERVAAYIDANKEFFDGVEWRYADKDEVFERVVWETVGDGTLEPNAVDAVSLPRSEAVTALHISSEPENWAKVLQEDYERGGRYRVVKIKAMPGDIIVDDVQQAMPTEMFGRMLDSGILVTGRETLKRGRDGVYKSTTALPPSARADIPGELAQAFGKLRARVLMRKITVLESQEEAKALVAALQSSGVDDGKFSIRERPAPKKTVKGYKLFRVDKRYPGKLFPLFVGANEAIDTGVWLDAEAGELTPAGKVKSKLGPLAYRPGWHGGDLPIATHIGQGGTPPTSRPANQVWAEVEFAAEVDWQAEAERRATKTKSGNVIPRTAHITDQVPADGLYRYKTNPNMTGQWIISGAMKVNRVLTDAEVESINDAAGVADLPRTEPFDAETFGIKYSKDGIIQGFTIAGKVYLVRDGIEKGHTVPVLKHEFAHIARLGLRGTKPWQALLRSVDERMNEESATGKALREARKKVPADTDASLMAEETLAYAVELSPEVGLVRRAIAMIKRFLVNMGVSPNIFTVEDWSALAAATLRGQARVAMGEGVRQSVREAIQQAKAFFSKLQQVSDDKFGGMKAQSVEPFLLKQGVKKTEIEATGLREWLAAMKPTDKVTKEQLRDFVRANTVEFEDVVLGGEEASFTPEELAQYEHLEELEAEGRLTPEEREMLGNMRWMEPVPQFPEYTEPGAIPGSYREMFVTAPGATGKLAKEVTITKESRGEEDGGGIVYRVTDVDGLYDVFESVDEAEGHRQWLEEQPDSERFTGWQDGHSPSARADIPGELTQAFGKLRARVLMRKITVLESQEEAKALVARLGGKLSAAWHGSPHEFDEFRMSAVGTGEGAQAYGYGLYFASARKVAEHYKTVLSNRDDQGYKNAHLNAKSVVERFGGDAEYAAEVLREYLDRADEGTAEHRRLADTLEMVESGRYKEDLERKGRLYKVELAPQEDEYLLWDRPLSEQSEKVRKALEDAGWGERAFYSVRNGEGDSVSSQFARSERDAIAKYGAMSQVDTEGYSAEKVDDYGGNDDGRELYGDISRKFASKVDESGMNGWTSIQPIENDRAASEYLHSLGIRGIKYMGESSYNYVIFDEKDIEITAKYSKDGAIQGIYANGKTYLVADGIAKNQAVPVLLHELGEHAAQLGFAGDREYQGILRSLEKRAEAQNATGKAIRAAMARVPEDTLPEHYWSEVAAYLVENKANGEIGIVKRILNFFKRWLYKAGAINADRLTPEDLVLFARSATLAHTGATYGEGVRQSVREAMGMNKQERRDKAQADLVKSKKRKPAMGERIRFIRYGEIISNSTNWTDNRPEVGMSVYSLAADGAAEQTVRSEFSDRGNAYVGTGTVVGYGSDGEPLVSDVAEVEKATADDIDKSEFYGMGKAAWRKYLDDAESGDLFKPVDTNSAAFKAWFGGSKVVDDEGRPAVVYHGTGADIDQFTPGINRRGKKTGDEFFNTFYFAWDKNLASEYTPNENGRVYPVYVSIKNPMPYAVENGGFDRGEGGGFKKDALFPGGFNETKADIEKAIANGYDGIIRKDEIIAFRSAQIKSALSNTGDFSPTDPRIRYSKQFDDGEVEAAMQVKSALKKNDLKWWERVFKTFDYLSRIDPAAKRIFQYGAEDRRENKVRLEDRILDDISVPDGAYIDPQYAEKKKAGFVSFLTNLQKKDKATYTAANDYLLTVDRTGKAFSVKRQEGYTVKSPDGEVLATGLRTKEDGYTVIRDHHEANYGNGSGVLKKDYSNDKQSSWVVTNQKGAVLSEHDTEAEAVTARREAEAGKMRADGKDEKTIAAVMKFREMTDRAFDLMAGDLRRVIDEAERLGLDEPTMEVVDERKRYVILDARGNKVPESYYENRKDAELFAESISHKGRFQVKKQEDNEILMPMTLSAAISQMGDLRGSYFPRQRQAGAVVLTATKDGSNIRKNFDLYMLGGERTDIETGEVLTESKIKTFLRDRANRVTPLGLEMARLKADGYTVRVAPADRMPETIFEATQLFASINALIEDAAKGVKKDADPNLQRAYNELAKTLTMNIADTFKQRGYLSSRMKRTQDYWEGFETDMLEAGVQYAKGMAGGLAKREAAQKMTLALTGRETTFAEYQDQNPGAKWEDYQQFVRDSAIDPKKQPRLLEETKSWMKEMLRNDEQADRILGTIKGLAVLKFLGFRVSSAAVNMTNMVQAVPATIAAQTGTSISRALGQVGSSARLYKQYRTGKAEQADKEIFTEISERGWDNPKFNHEAAAVLRSKAGNWFAKFTDAAMWMFGQAEKVNRAVTIHAAYMQAKRMSPDLGHVGWMNKARQISDDAHGVYGKETAPAWTRGAYNPLKLAYTFQRFMHNYFLNMGQMWERGKYKELTWMLISPALIAGPGATLLTPIAASMLGALGIGGDDPEEEFYTWAEQTFGEGSTGARVARHGFSGALGVNLKGSLEMGFAMPTTVAELFGAPGSLVTDAVDSVRAFGKGEVSKGFEKALPTGIGTMLKANREQREGVTTGGYSPVWYGEEPLKTTGGGSVARFFGFNPSVTSGVREKLWSEKRIEQKYAGERKRINDRIRRLVLQNNGRIPREDMDEIRGEVARYNERARGLAVPGVPLIKASTIRQAIRSAKRPPRKERLRTNPNI